MLRLDGKVALVTGCGTVGPGWGNGKAISVLLARQGASVFGVDLNLEAAHATQKLIHDEGGVAEVHDVEGRGTLVEIVAITSRIEAE